MLFCCFDFRISFGAWLDLLTDCSREAPSRPTIFVMHKTDVCLPTCLSHWQFDTSMNLGVDCRLLNIALPSGRVSCSPTFSIWNSWCHSWQSEVHSLCMLAYGIGYFFRVMLYDFKFSASKLCRLSYPIRPSVDWLGEEKKSLFIHSTCNLPHRLLACSQVQVQVLHCVLVRRQVQVQVPVMDSLTLDLVISSGVGKHLPECSLPVTLWCHLESLGNPCRGRDWQGSSLEASDPKS